MDNRETILVTGCAGFIGSHFTKLAIKEGFNVVGLDLMTYAANMKNLSGVSSNRFTLVEGDICDQELVEKLCQDHKVTTIFNFAAESHVDRSIEDSSVFLKTNVLGVVALLEVSKRLGLYLVQISTDEVYGSVQEPSQHERTLVRPGNPYSASKAAAENFVMSYANTHKIKALLTRCCNNYGPGQHEEKLVPKMVLKLVCGESVTLYGTGDQVRCWVFVEDHCRAIMKAFKVNKNKEGLSYLDIGGARMTNLDMIEKLAEAADVSNYDIVFVEDRKGHDQQYWITDQANASNFEQKLRTTVNSYLR